MPRFARGDVEIDYDDLPGPRDGGGKLPIVLGHSFLFTRAMWMFQTRALAETRRVINVDLRGHGRSSPAPAPVTMDQLAGELLALLDHLELPRAVLAGLSIGGMTSMRVAARHPDRVAGLILIDTQAQPEIRAKQIAYQALARVVETAGTRAIAPILTPIYFAPKFRRDDPATVRAWQQVWREADVPSMLAVFGALSGRGDVTGELANIRAPTLVLHGAADAAISVARAKDMADHIPGASFHVVPHAGHISAVEAAGEVTRRMVDFLARVP